MNTNNAEIDEILRKYKKICIIGISSDQSKPSYRVPLFLKSKGYDIVGVRPGGGRVGDFICYSSLSEVPGEYRKFVDVFRPPQAIPEVVEEVLKVGGVEVLFLQLGITHPDAEKRAEEEGAQSDF
ncbi:MAG: CoA-binding protein [Bdellovibrionaceae bacterium]|nr:CoA-binding protein [Pseudobdellovibrionaceae bacterium]